MANTGAAVRASLKAVRKGHSRTRLHFEPKLSKVPRTFGLGQSRFQIFRCSKLRFSICWSSEFRFSIFRFQKNIWISIFKNTVSKITIFNNSIKTNKWFRKRAHAANRHAPAHRFAAVRRPSAFLGASTAHHWRYPARSFSPYIEQSKGISGLNRMKIEKDHQNEQMFI